MNTDNNNFKELIRVMNERQRVLKNALVKAQDETSSYILKQHLNRCVQFTNYYKESLAHDSSPKTPILVKELLEIEKEALNQDINNYGLR